MRILTLWLFLLSLTISSFGQNKKTIVPPGTIKLNDSLYIDVTPVDNVMIVEYLNQDKDSYKDKDYVYFIVLDSSEAYLKNPKYQHYPVLNFTKEEAQAFCKWRTGRVRKIWGQRELASKDVINQLLYRLPTTLEMEEAIAAFGFSKKKRRYLKDYNLHPYALKQRKKYKIAIFLKNNLSEYTLDSIPFGGNWRNKNTFDAANDYTGFRCVCEMAN